MTSKEHLYRLMDVGMGTLRMVSVANPAWHSTYDGEWVRADHHAAEVARLRNDIQELTCGDPRKACPNCRGASETDGELERLRAVNAELLAELHHHFGCDPECEKRHALKTAEEQSRVRAMEPSI